MSPTSYQAALPRVIPSLLSATLIIIPYSNSFVKGVRKVFLQRKQRTKTRLLTFFPESQQPRCIDSIYSNSQKIRSTTISSKPGKPILRRNESKCQGDHLGQKCSNVAAQFPQSSLRLRPQHFNRIQIRAVWRQIEWNHARCTQHFFRALDIRYFNSRPSARGDDTFVDVPAGCCTFQFPPLREGRRTQPPHASPHPPYFNSRPSARGDGVWRTGTRLLRISIHAPPRGVTHAVPD